MGVKHDPCVFHISKLHVEEKKYTAKTAHSLYPGSIKWELYVINPSHVQTHARYHWMTRG